MLSHRTKNVLILHTDEHTHSLLGCMEHKTVRTPNIDALARDGSLFTNAYSCSGVCVPSRAALLTGRYTVSHGVTMNSNRMPPSERTMGKVFAEHGYDTGYFGKTHFGGNDADMAGEGWGESFTWHGQYNEYLRDHGVDAHYPEGLEIRRPDIRFWNVGTSRIPSAHYFENAITDHAIQFIRGHRDRGFLCFVGFLAPHGPFSPPAPYDAMYDPDEVELLPRHEGELRDKHPHFVKWVTQNQKYLTEEELRIFMATVYGLITLVDDNVGRLVNALKDAGLYDQTLIHFTADHGDFGSQYGIIGKSWCMIDNIMRIPFIVRHPDHPSPKTLDALVQNVDVLPTLLEYAGIPVPHKVQGVSVAPLLAGHQETVRQAAFGYDQAEYSGGHSYQSMIRTGPWKLVQPGCTPAELYHMDDDPWETTNLAPAGRHRDVIRDLQERLLRWHVESAGGFYPKETARYWEDETCFYDETRFCGLRLAARGDAPV